MTAVVSRHRHTVNLVTHLVAREFSIRYSRSLLGWLWALAEPLARLVVFTFFFTRVIPLGVPNYAVFLFTGLIGWAFFASAVQSATNSAVDRRELLLRPGVSRTVVPVVSVLTDGLDYLAALPVLLVFLTFSTGIPWTALLLPIVLLPMLLLALGLGMALCAANVYVRDVKIFVSITLLLGFYVTPVFYNPDSVPADAAWLLQINPMAHLLAAQRSVLVFGELPELVDFAALTGLCALVFLVGAAVYHRSAPTFVDEL